MKRLLAVLSVSLLWASIACAQVWFGTPNGNVNAQGWVAMCPNGASPIAYVPCSATYPLPVSPTNSSGAPLYVVPAPYPYTALGCQQITSLASAAPFASVPTGAKLAVVTPEVQPVRYRDDGTAPTASVGPLLYPGLVWSYSGALSAIQFIQTAASATLDVCFYK